MRWSKILLLVNEIILNSSIGGDIVDELLMFKSSRHGMCKVSATTLFVRVEEHGIGSTTCVSR